MQSRRTQIRLLAAYLFAVPLLLATGVGAQESLPGEKPVQDSTGKRPEPLDETRRIIKPVFSRGEAAVALAGINEIGPEFVQAQLGLPPSYSLEPKTSSQVGSTWIVTYSLRYGDIPFSDAASASLVVRAAEDSAASVRSRNLPRSGVDTVSPTITSDKALSIARAHFDKVVDWPPSPPPVTVSSPTLLFEPGDFKTAVARLCWSFTLSAEVGGKPYKHLYSITATEPPTIVREQSLVQYDYIGGVAGAFWPLTPVDPSRQGPLPNLRVAAAAGPNAFADATGRFRLPGIDATKLTASLESEVFRIENQSTAVQQLTATADATDAAEVALQFAQSREEEIAQTSAYYWANEARKFAGAALGVNDLRPTRVLVNVDSTCNASFTAPNTIRLFRGGPDANNPQSTCVNRAYADTIFHEFGHAVDSVLGGILSSSYSEGFGDAMAILYTRHNCYGRNTRGPDTCLRRADNAFAWPGADLAIHTRGQIYSGFVWELVNALRASGATVDEAYQIAHELTIGAALLNPTNIQHAVELTLEIDDDDGILSNGTPHDDAIRTAAEKKNLWKSEWLSGD